MSSLEEKLAHLYSLRQHNLSRQSPGFRDNYLSLLEKLGNPHRKLSPVVHVAGTNGKGSTVAFLRAMVESAGYKAHVYTSPHLVRFNERIVLAGQEIEDAPLNDLLGEVMAQAQDFRDPLTFFEITTAMAFLAFSRQPADIVLLETGMGGRIDCTNVVEQPVATIITRISLDHREHLGDTHELIAAEKAGIMKKGVPCVIGRQMDDSVWPVFESQARRCDTVLHRCGSEWDTALIEKDPTKFSFRYGAFFNIYSAPALPGRHQIDNAGAALSCTHLLDSFSIHDESREKGLTRVKWPARLQRLAGGRLDRLLPPGWALWLDGGHNDSAGQVLGHHAAIWNAADPQPLHLIIGMMANKHPEEFLTPMTPFLESVTAVPIPGNEGACTPEALAALARQAGAKTVHTAPDVESALRALAALDSGKPARVLIAGSLYLAGSVLRG